MTPLTLKQVIDCMGATVRNDKLQPTSDPPLTLSLKAKDKQIYVLPPSERGAVRLLEVLSQWRQGRGVGKRDAGKGSNTCK
jgi:hypothetical protein